MDSTLKAKARIKDSTLKAKDRTKDTTVKAKDRIKNNSQAKDRTKDLSFVHKAGCYIPQTVTNSNTQNWCTSGKPEFEEDSFSLALASVVRCVRTHVQ